MSGFDFGAEIVGGGKIVQASVGPHEARIKGIMHLGMIADEFKKGGKVEIKSPAAFVHVICEIRDDEDAPERNEDGSPICIGRSFPLKKGDKALLTAFMKAVLTADEYKQYQNGTLEGGFDALIGRPVQIDVVAGKKMNDSDEVYTNLKSFTGMTAKARKGVAEMEGEPIGHIRLEQYTPENIKHLPPFEIWGRMEKASNFPGSAAEEALLAVREDNPDFGTKGTNSSSDEESEAAVTKSTPKPPADLDDETDFS